MSSPADRANAKIAACNCFASGLPFFDISDVNSPRGIAYLKPPAQGAKPLPGSALISSFVGERGATTGAAASRAVIASIASDMWISLLHHGRGGVVMDEPAALSPIFVARLERGREQVGRWSDTLERTLQELAASGRAAWPGIALDSETFRAHLGDRLRKCPDLKDALATIDATDLFLACACAHGVPEALGEFERAYLSRVSVFVRRIEPSAAFADDVAQSMRETFLVRPPDGGARVAQYSGRGALASWVRAVAVRTALRLRRKRNDDAASQHVMSEPRPSFDPELDYLKLRYRGAYEVAVQAALPDRDALLLKLRSYPDEQKRG